ncbi:MAG: PTS transporter subunit EIIC [Lactobacillus sp.]|jgi:PTS system cellobiose-specific IIC component|uniref:Permease IIC component n=1 Tax=Lacticaseibacillus suilingensis TaxID=2799577 RepID=A0ABW4BED1_9LACO|nr:PTS transporter subunit EIIC [Lacticaseibacillus suilingensis]MCI1894196.1 PTS transporter subunit EIIC [Lactobacillus sp.]MCI1941580.1 PTS transporter subunit EIIC [Lactobacillus sp.]MCI1972126.1 PTS transporter subunit EIIC [Lactobacillus sp.]MCI2036795.1 PTS transporter subunit EIIC [Lactobacillus sp.]
MQKFLNWIEAKMMPPMVKLSQNRYLVSIRDGIIATMPLVMLGSFFVLIAQFPIGAWTKFVAPYVATIMLPYRITVGLMAVYAAFGIGYQLAKHYELDALSSGLISMGAFLMTTIPVLANDAANAKVSLGMVMPMTYLGGSGMFTAIIVAIFSTEIIHFCAKHNITIKMPDQVPESVSKSFAAIIPSAVVIIVVWVISGVLHFNINSALMTLFKPIVDVGMNSYFGLVLPPLLITLLWATGIHGDSIIGNLVRPFWLILWQQNADAVAAGHAAANIATEGFYTFVWIGGSGGTLALCLIAMLFAKSAYLKQIGKLAFIPGVFNINEPIIFGAPVVLNPLLAIPFIVGPFITSTITYFAMYFDLVNKTSMLAPFTVPFPIMGYMITQADVRAVVLMLLNFAIYLAIYYPFTMMYDKQLLKQEREEKAEEDAEAAGTSATA